MKSPESNFEGNPLSDIISDEIYRVLKERNLFNRKSLRDHIIRRKYKMLRQKNIATSEAISLIREEYPYLQFDTIRKIVYNII